MAEIKPHYSTERTILADVVPLEMPYSVQVEPSQVCNLKCNYCIHGLEKGGKKMMDMAIFKKICESIKEFPFDLKQLNFAGWGEPLVNGNLPDMIAMAKEQGIAQNIAVITNGVWLIPEIAGDLIEAGVDHIRISLQGMSSGAYLRISNRRVDFDRFVENIDWLFENKGNCKVSIKVADIGLQEGEEQKFYDIFGPITDQMYVEKIRPMFPQQEHDGKAISKYGIEHKPVIVCPLPFFMMSVTAEGNIFPCCHYYDPLNLGSIKGVSLSEAWNGIRMKTFMRSLLFAVGGGVRSWPVCRECVMPDAVITPGDCLDDKAEKILRRME